MLSVEVYQFLYDKLKTNPNLQDNISAMEFTKIKNNISKYSKMSKTKRRRDIFFIKLGKMRENHPMLLVVGVSAFIVTVIGICMGIALDDGDASLDTEQEATTAYYDSFYYNSNKGNRSSYYNSYNYNQQTIDYNNWQSLYDLYNNGETLYNDDKASTQSRE